MFVRPDAERQAASGAETTAQVPRESEAIRTHFPPEIRHDMIARAAYGLAERRGFALAGELEDWLTAERDVDAQLAAGPVDLP